MDPTKLLNSPFLSNVIFLVDNKRFYAHKIIISTKSTYFFNIVRNQSPNVSSTLEIQLPPTISHRHFFNVLEFIYTSKTEITNDNYMNLYYSSILFNLFQLKEKCHEFIVKNLSTRNVFQIWYKSKQYCDVKLILRIIEFIKRFIVKKYNFVGFENLSVKSEPNDVFKRLNFLNSTIFTSSPRNLGVFPNNFTDLGDKMDTSNDDVFKNDNLENQIIKINFSLEDVLMDEKFLVKLLQFMLISVSNLVSCERGSIFLLNMKNKEFYSLISISDYIINIPVNKGIVGLAFNSGKLINCSNPYTNKNFYNKIDLNGEFRTKNIVCVPIRNKNNQIIGLIEVLNKENGNFNQNDEFLLNYVSKLFGYLLNDFRLTVLKNKIILINPRVVESKSKSIPGLFNENFTNITDLLTQNQGQLEKTPIPLIEKTSSQEKESQFQNPSTPLIAPPKPVPPLPPFAMIFQNQSEIQEAQPPPIQSLNMFYMYPQKSSKTFDSFPSTPHPSNLLPMKQLDNETRESVKKRFANMPPLQGDKGKTSKSQILKKRKRDENELKTNFGNMFAKFHSVKFGENGEVKKKKRKKK